MMKAQMPIGYTAAMDERFPIMTPAILIVFGATGDLFRKKIVPAIKLLKDAGRLPSRFAVVGFGRRVLDDAGFRAHVAEALSASGLGADPALPELFSYIQGEFEDSAAFLRLKMRVNEIDAAWGLCSAKAFYLAVPPEFFHTLFKQLDGAGLTEGCDAAGLPARILIEKPFGGNLREGQALNASLKEFFDESEVYRIEHYLEKDSLRAIVPLRRANAALGALLKPENIASIHVRLLETIGVETRGAFYDKIGAWKDVGENHLVEMLALSIMDLPKDESAASVRAARTAFIATLPISRTTTSRGPACARNMRDMKTSRELPPAR